jgi:hypothetical protein
MPPKRKVQSAKPSVSRKGYTGKKTRKEVEEVVEKEALFQDEPSLPLQDDDGKFSCPLHWWKNYQKNIRLSPSWLYVYY